MCTKQDVKGAIDYLNTSSLVQGKTFDSLIEKFKIKNGIKVIDIGCGTGNNSFKLSQMVGENGKVIATDPIKERIQTARETFLAPNLEFYEAFGKEAPKFGNGFDLCVSSTVLHWIPPEEKLPTFQGISQCLKADGTFIFNTTKPKSLKAAVLFSKMNTKVSNQVNNHLYDPSEKELRELALKSGFKQISIEEEEVSIALPSLDDFIHWAAASLHVGDYNLLLNELQELFSKEDISCLYNDKGQVVYEETYFYAICSK